MTDSKIDGAHLLGAIAASLEVEKPMLVMELIGLNLAWLEGNRKTRRTRLALIPDAHVRRQLSEVDGYDPAKLEAALLRAIREITEGSLKLRIGLVDVAKQAETTADLWPGNVMPKMRCADRVRKNRHFLVSSKVLGDVVLPGPTYVISPYQRPTHAVLQVIRAIRNVDSRARIVGVDLDEIDAEVGTLLREDPLPTFGLRLPALLRGEGMTCGPMALKIPRGDWDKLKVDHGAQDLRGLRIGQRGHWLDSVSAELDGPSCDGRATTLQRTIKLTEEIVIRVPGGMFRGHVANVRSDLLLGEMRTPGLPDLVAVIGAEDQADAIRLVVDTLSATDKRPDIAEFIQERNQARVFKGEQETRRALAVDRFLASAALAVYQLDQRQRAPAPAPIP